MNLPSEARPEGWLLKLAEGEGVKDRYGKLVYLGQSYLELDWEKSHGQTLRLDYYDISTRKVKQAIKDALQPKKPLSGKTAKLVVDDVEYEVEVK